MTYSLDIYSTVKENCILFATTEDEKTHVWQKQQHINLQFASELWTNVTRK